jgi:hypothetical protein
MLAMRAGRKASQGLWRAVWTAMYRLRDVHKRRELEGKNSRAESRVAKPGLHPSLRVAAAVAPIVRAVDEPAALTADGCRSVVLLETARAPVQRPGEIARRAFRGHAVSRAPGPFEQPGIPHVTLSCPNPRGPAVHAAQHANLGASTSSACDTSPTARAEALFPVQLDELPPSLGALLRLEHLDAADNCLTALPVSRRHLRHICAGTGLTPATSAPGLGSPPPHLRRDWTHSGHICTRAGLAPAHICAGTSLTPATSAPRLGAVGLVCRLRSRRASRLTRCSSREMRFAHCRLLSAACRCATWTSSVTGSLRCRSRSRPRSS